MTNVTRENKANRLRQLIQRRIRFLFDDGQTMRAVRLVDRLNAVTKIVYWGETPKTPGDLLNDYLEDRAFESRL